MLSPRRVDHHSRTKGSFRVRFSGSIMLSDSGDSEVVSYDEVSGDSNNIK